MPAIERGELLHEVATRLRARTDELARVMTLEGGKPLIENTDEVGWTAAAFDYYAEIGRNFAGRVIPSIESTQLALVLKEPMGVVGCIVPWNYPLLLLAWKLAPALAAGNTTVCKPSELTPLSTLMLASCFDHLPAGVVNLLAGAGDVGARIVADERVDCVAFTGSVETGKAIARVCADRDRADQPRARAARTRSSCARTSPANVDVAARGGAWAAYLNAGQVCTSAERFYVMEPVYDDFLQAFVDHTETLVVGDPLDAATDIGPHGLGGPACAGIRTGRGCGRGRGDAGARRRGKRPRPLLHSRDRHGRARGDGPAARGDLRAGGADRAGEVAGRGDRAGQRRPASAWARTSTPATWRRSCAACARSRRARSGSTTR